MPRPALQSSTDPDEEQSHNGSVITLAGLCLQVTPCGWQTYCPAGPGLAARLAAGSWIVTVY